MQDCPWSQNLLVAQSRSTSVIGPLQEGLESDHEFVSKPRGGHEQTIIIDTCRVEASAPMAYESWRSMSLKV